MAPTLFEEEPKPGDLIEISRRGYQHWAIYIGHNEVVHMTPPSEESGLLDNLLSLLDNNTAQVRRQKIWSVVGSDSYIVNNLLDDEYQPREPHLIVREACRMVDQVQPYCIATRNCEHFVTELRYGKAESRQVHVATGAVMVGAGLVATAALGAVLFGALLKDDNKRRRRRDQ